MSDSFDEERLQRFSPYDRAMILYQEWPIDESLGRPAGQTSQIVREMVAEVNGLSLAATNGTQQYCTPDRLTAGAMIKFGRECGLDEKDIDSIYEAMAERELFHDRNEGEYPLPLSAYPKDEVQQKLAELKAELLS